MKVNYRMLDYLEKNGFHSNNWMKLHGKTLRRRRQYIKLRNRASNICCENKPGESVNQIAQRYETTMQVD